jgi:hypothetical protein
MSLEILDKIPPVNYKGKQLIIPRVAISDYKTGVDDRGRAITADGDRFWLQVATTPSLEAAISIVNEALIVDSEIDRNVDNPTTAITPAKLRRTIMFGQLPQPITQYINQGFTHLALGEAIDTHLDPTDILGQIGVWRPVSSTCRYLRQYIPGSAEGDSWQILDA